jgi:hypothetical protein
VFRSLIGFLAAGLVVALVQPAAATTTNYAFSGTVDANWVSAGFDNLLGTNFSGTFTLSDQGTYSGPALGGAWYTVPGEEVKVTYNGNTFLADGTSATRLRNTFFGDDYLSSFGDAAPTFNGEVMNFTALVVLRMLDGSGAALTSSTLALPDALKFATKILEVTFLWGGFLPVAYYHGTLNSFAAVPLPAGLPLLVAGVGALGLVGWRKRRAAARAHA